MGAHLVGYLEARPGRQEKELVWEMEEGFQLGDLGLVQAKPIECE